MDRRFDGRMPPLTAGAQKKREECAGSRSGVDIDAPTAGGFVEDLGPGRFRVRCILGFTRARR